MFLAATIARRAKLRRRTELRCRLESQASFLVVASPTLPRSHRTPGESALGGDPKDHFLPLSCVTDAGLRQVDGS